MDIALILNVSILILVWLIIIGVIGTLILWFKLLNQLRAVVIRSSQSWMLDLTKVVIKLIRGRG